jgi:hypothetical protein
VLSTDCQWNALPTDLPRKSTVHGLSFPVGLGRQAGAHPPRALFGHPRAGRPGSQPSVAIIDAQRRGSGKRGRRSTPRVMTRARGSKDASAISSSKLLLSVVIHPADVQDRDSAAAVLRQARRSFPFIERIYGPGDRQASQSTALGRLALMLGSSNGPSPRSATAVDSPRISSVMLAKPLLSSASP